MLATGTIFSFLGGKQNGTAMWKDSLAVSYEARQSLSICPAIMLLGSYPTGWKTYIYSKPAQIFIATFIVIAKNWKQLRCSFNKRMDIQSMVV